MKQDPGIDASVLKTILQQYDFYAGQIDELVPIPQRLTNQNARFRIGDKQWVIKRYDDAEAPQRLALSHQVQRLLCSQGFPVARLEITKSDLTLVPENGCFYSVHEWVSGKHVNGVAMQLGGKTPSEDVIGAIARALGTYHRLMQEFFPQTGANAATHATDKAIQQPASLAARIRQKQQKQKLQFLWRKLKPNKSALDRWLEDIDDILAQADDLARLSASTFLSPQDLIVAHNDLNWENLIFDEGYHLKAIIDFDNVTVTHRMFEVGAACIVFTGTDHVLRNRFLDVYRQSSGLDTDTVALTAGMKLKCLRSLLWSVWSYLNGNIVDREMLTEWCIYLAKCLEALNAVPGDAKSSSP